MKFILAGHRKYLIALNLFVYSVLLAMMGSCAHFTSTSPISKTKLYQSKDAAVVGLQYSLINIEQDDHTLILRDSAGDLLEIEVSKNTDTKKGFLVEVAANRTYQMEAIGLSHKTYLLKNLTQKFLARPGKINYLGVIQFELKNDELMYSVLPPIMSLNYLKDFLTELKLQASELSNPYTGKTMENAFQMSKLNVINGKLENSFQDYVAIINPCYVKEWKTNPYILGELDFLVTQYNGVLRVKNQKSKHTGSEEFEACVWNSISASNVKDKDFQLKLPGVLYF